jgi:hypothetical protein
MMMFIVSHLPIVRHACEKINSAFRVEAESVKAAASGKRPADKK